MAAEPLIWSRSELTALLLKAGRGAGMPLAHAEDMARAVGRRGDGRAVEAVLQGLGKPWVSMAMEVVGNRISISNARAVQALPHVVEALSSGFDAAVLLDLDEPCLLAAYLHGTGLGAKAEGAHWHVKRGAAAPDAGEPRPITAHQVARLETFAARTYVPASATSRDGAGQGADQD
ncbi:MAG: hypothetical protein AAGH70_03425 [Pseudomonadota bacterium]